LDKLGATLFASFLETVNSGINTAIRAFSRRLTAWSEELLLARFTEKETILQFTYLLILTATEIIKKESCCCET